ncbi:50S ribosomal protein L21 [Candidatus Mycoplasma haematominutum]|uniref:50S ribosomal protein L21 n=1 Tax=Candidatus Mycoplasma haematominutum 'Birmingham 1' TaxID=1116213 RepID=G8C307_9MOLU|nr:50S ribosomal protein L21 [Candidatus Mycoplasma haematominutum]CCE66705.1 ribosomal protein L21 [Candidatus Mycoplasma haematominutum 'Birmingham 1']
MSEKNSALCFEIRNKQYLCNPGDELYVDHFAEANPGDELSFQKILLWESSWGSPYVPNLEVKCKVIKHVKDKKIHILHLISQKRHRKRRGFRAKKTLLKVVEVKQLS